MGQRKGFCTRAKSEHSTLASRELMRSTKLCARFSADLVGLLPFVQGLEVCLGPLQRIHQVQENNLTLVPSNEVPQLSEASRVPVCRSRTPASSGRCSVLQSLEVVLQCPFKLQAFGRRPGTP